MSRAEPRSTLTALQDQIRAAAQARAPLAIRGGGTKDFYGERVVGTVLDVAAHAGIVDYEPTELVLTARAGTPLEEIESAMQASGQMLAFEPPRFGPESTLGGVIAAGLSGPRRPYGGAARDLMLGVRILDGTGEELTFGGQVMKNVAGFDVSRLMTGSLGTLGVITEVSLKCMPLPKAEVTLVFAFRPDEALRKVNEWGAQALPLSATCYHDGRLSLRLSGAEPAVAAAMRKLGGTVDDGGPAFWASIRDQTHPVLAGSDALGGDLWRLSIGASAPYADWSGTQLIEWGGALRWLRAGPGDDAARIRAWAAAQGGHANLYRAADKSAGVFAPLSAPVRGLHERLKAVFDPHGILNPGRMYPDL